MTVRVLVVAHPHRRRRAVTLAESTGGTVVLDPEPERAGPAGPWRTMRHAILIAAAERLADHVCLIQDDAVPARGFTRAVEAIVANVPGQLVVLFTPRHADQSLSMLVASVAEHGGGLAYVRPEDVGEWIPTVGVIAPLRVLEDVTVLADQEDWTGVRADDWILGAWARRRGAGYYACAPNIVDHDASARSIANGPYVHRRSSSCPMRPQDDASRIAWVPAGARTWRPS